MAKSTRFGSVFRYQLLCVLCALLLSSVRAYPQEVAYFGAGVGVFKVFHEDENPHLNGYGLINYRPAIDLFGYGTWSSLAYTDREVYLSGGILQDFYLTESIVITPSFGLGIYLENDGADMGSPLEFRPEVKASYEFVDRSRLGVSFGHVSNAELGEENPGANYISVMYSIPLNIK
ncbi:MAG: acyloxyacyl hydrolase [Desulfohalobiaceae bacterium]|nr:acyloxyacyl hydrolase [Desulfohalobiaceae bacterium]